MLLRLLRQLLRLPLWLLLSPIMLHMKATAIATRWSPRPLKLADVQRHADNMPLNRGESPRCMTIHVSRTHAGKRAADSQTSTNPSPCPACAPRAGFPRFTKPQNHKAKGAQSPQNCQLLHSMAAAAVRNAMKDCKTPQYGCLMCNCCCRCTAGWSAVLLPPTTNGSVCICHVSKMQTRW